MLEILREPQAAIAVIMSQVGHFRSVSTGSFLACHLAVLAPEATAR